MKKGYAYNPNNPSHPNLDFVGKISPFCENETCCSCVLVSPNHVLTAWHCLTSPCGDFCVQFPKGRKNQIREFRRIAKSDIAIAVLEKTETCSPIRIANFPVELDQTTIMAGYGVNQDKFDLRFGFARVTKLFNDKMLCDDPHTLSPVATSGDSGGPVLSHDGQDLFLSGVISKSYNDSCCILPYYQEIMTYSFSTKETISKEQFDNLCKLEFNRRKLVENGFATESQDDWTDIDNWFFNQLDKRSE